MLSDTVRGARVFGLVLVVESMLAIAAAQSAQSPGSAAKAVSGAMAPLDQYLIADAQQEITLARSAAPASISDGADVMVLRRDGYVTAVKGTNGFLCIVERSWGAQTTDPGFWDPTVRAPICFNPAGARTFVPIYLLKTRLVLAGRTKTEIVQATDSAFAKGELRPLEPGAMCYMMSRQQSIGHPTNRWHPHLMFLVSGSVAKSWGADLPGSPVIAADDPEERATIFLVWVGKWSDGTQFGPTM